MAGRVRSRQHLVEDSVKTKTTCLQSQVWIKARVQSKSTLQPNQTEPSHVVKFLIQNLKRKEAQVIVLKENEVRR